jgi:hypothetical protein
MSQVFMADFPNMTAGAWQAEMRCGRCGGRVEILPGHRWQKLNTRPAAEAYRAPDILCGRWVFA